MNDAERLERENQRLAEEIKRLVKAERQLYEVQEHLDEQMRIYRRLYEVGQKFNATFDVATVVDLTTHFVIYDLNFERCLLFLRAPDQPGFRVAGLDGYYDVDVAARVASLSLPKDTVLATARGSGAERVMYADHDSDAQLRELSAALGMDEYAACLLGGEANDALGLLVAGNTAANAQYHARIEAESESLLGLAHLVS